MSDDLGLCRRHHHGERRDESHHTRGRRRQVQRGFLPQRAAHAGLVGPISKSTRAGIGERREREAREGERGGSGSERERGRVRREQEAEESREMTSFFRRGGKEGADILVAGGL